MCRRRGRDGRPLRRHGAERAPDRVERDLVADAPNASDRPRRAHDESYGTIASGHRSGGHIWIDRSRDKMPKAAMHPSTSSVLSTGKGWKECGPFNRRSTSMVLHWDTKAVRHYTARVCIDPVGTTPYHCGAWYVDAS